MTTFLILLGVIAVIWALDLYFGWTRNWFAGQARHVGREFARQTYHSHPAEIEAYGEKALTYFALLKERGLTDANALKETKKHYKDVYRHARERTLLEIADEKIKRARKEARRK